MNSLLEKLYAKEDLSFTETNLIFKDIFAGKIDPIVFGSLLTSLKMNGYTADEIGGAATAMIDAALPFERERSIDTGEIVGTGGDRLKTINISTISAFVCATLGLHVAKHGNTAVSSKSGASDVLTELGYNIRAEADITRKCLEEEGFAFFFAQKYHTGMKYAAPVRKALGTSTIFNILGPLTNPARVNYELLGCYDVTGVQRAMVINGNGMDEISIFGQTHVSELKKDGTITNYILTNEDFGIRGNFRQEELVGGSPEENARSARAVLEGRGTDAHNAVVAANVSAMLYLAEKVNNFKDGYEMAYDTIRSGRAIEKLETITRMSNS